MKTGLTYLKKFELFKELDTYKEGQFFAVADHAIKNHLPQWIQFSPHVFWLTHPEQQKDLETYGRALEFFLKQGIHRGSRLYAFGGGATTDFSGLVAATILRGISWVAVPTTLLAMIDGSIGGKVAINMPQGKNLVGAFHLPETVYLCGEFLNTLSPEEWVSGKGEMLKYGFLSREIHDLILKKTPLDDVAHECARFKVALTEKDLRERGNRILLNLGHTLGHAFESTLQIPHGQAVGMGLRYIFEIFGLKGAREAWSVLAKALNLDEAHYRLSTYTHFDPQKFFHHLEHDKKRSDSSIKVILVREVGDCFVEEIPMKDLKAKILAHVDFSH